MNETNQTSSNSMGLVLAIVIGLVLGISLSTRGKYQLNYRQGSGEAK